MSTLSLRKIKHDSSVVDNITLGSTGRVSVKAPGADGLILETDTNDSTCSTRILAKNDTYTGGMYYDNTGWNITTGSTIGSASGSSRLNITRDGYVRTPNSPAWHYLGGTNCVSNTYVTIVPSTAVISHSGYSTSTGLFTAPVSGKYIVGVWGLVYPHTASYFNYRYIKNGTQVGHLVQGSWPNGSHNHHSSSLLVHLEVGDTIGYQLYRTAEDGANAYSTQWNQYGYFLG